MHVCFACPLCERPARLLLGVSTDWQCPACDHRLRFEAVEPALPVCAVCGNKELYKKKDFPHTLGMGILVAACVVSFFTYGWYEKWLTWALLIGTFLFDGILHFWVGDAIVCYRCHAHYRGFQAADAHKPFELTIGERYRQEQIRREQL
ncbi:MAG: hypothetical protein HY040_10020 [Planctomycetes bacterium]|nr:hypothetical protein [Planctomycetota bacterium]